jgi:integrase
MAASTVRQIHAVISGALSAAVRWDWIATNPARGAQRPRQRPPQPDPPSPSDAARLVDGAFAVDEDWGTLAWLVMTTGMRRGEVCALRWARVNLARRLGIDTHIHALRHYLATELLTAGVDLRTVAGRLGHGGGGATTLRVYAAWVAATDRKAAEILGARMPKRSSMPTTDDG